MRIVQVPISASVIITDVGCGCRLTIPLTVAAIPGSGGDLTVEYQVAPGGTWLFWPDGVVLDATVNILNGPVYALRFTAGTADGVVEIGS